MRHAGFTDGKKTGEEHSKMLRISRQILHVQNISKLCARSMAKKRPPLPKKTIAKMRADGWIIEKGRPKKKLPNVKVPWLNIILTEQHETLGNAGQMVSVEPRLARNFLIPEGMAVYATEENKIKFLRKDALDENAEAAIDSEFLSFLKDLHLKIQRKEGKEFFEVNEHHIALEFESQFELFVPVHCVKLDKPIRLFGEFEVNIAVRDNVLVPMKVSVEQWDPVLPDWVKDAMKSEGRDIDEEQLQAKTN